MDGFDVTLHTSVVIYYNMHSIHVLEPSVYLTLWLSESTNNTIMYQYMFSKRPPLHAVDFENMLNLSSKASLYTIHVHEINTNST